MATLKEAYNEIIESNLNEPEERKTYLQDLTQHGAISGMVSGLIYYNETTQFFNEHRDEILAMLDEMKEEKGLDEEQLFGEKWQSVQTIVDNDYNSALILEDFKTEQEYQEALNEEYSQFVENIDELENIYNQNLLAWFAVEELAKKELEELEAE
ncbi:hypothetical protein [Enterococcus phage TJE1]|uniref:DUF7222 domain-containing protein n=1 Tax=Enterococcus phage TJE1 TaxID=2951262 RepID=A0A976XQT2_9CAUD|nr:hypothetical protein [Enterococcus phage TJE1]